MDTLTFTDRELLLLMNSAQLRASYLLDVWADINRTHYTNRAGAPPSRSQIEDIKAGADEHFDLVSKIRTIKKERE